MSTIKSALLVVGGLSGILLATTFAVSALVVPARKEQELKNTRTLLLENNFSQAAAGCFVQYLDANVPWTNGLNYRGVQLLPAVDPNKTIREASEYCGITEQMASFRPDIF